jgi:hypothetical protein
LVLTRTYLISSKDQSRLAPPWQGWEPDPDFLYKLHKWNVAHKHDKLPAVLTKVNNVLESKPLQAALEFIPNSPFPAKSLVKAMMSLFLLGSVSDDSSQTPYQLPILIISHPPRKFLRQSRTSMAFRIRSLLISLTLPKYLARLEVVSCRRKLGKICRRQGGQLENFVIRL